MPSLPRANFSLSLHLSGPKAFLLTINLPARFLGKDVWRSVPRFASIHFELRSRLWRYCFALRRSVTPFWGRNFVLVSFATPKWSINTLRGGRFFFPFCLSPFPSPFDDWYEGYASKGSKSVPGEVPCCN